MQRIIIIGLSSLESMALRDVVDHHTPAYVMVTDDLDGVRPKFDGSRDGFIISSDEFIKHLDFYLPRKGRVIVVSDTSSASIPVDRNEKSMMTINRDSDYDEIIDKVKSLAGIINESGGESTVLSDREKEVLRGLASGLTNKEIADALCISPTTVITHRKNISSKLGIRSISGLSLYALMNGIVNY